MNVKESKKLRKKSETQRQGLILEGDSSVPHCASCTACNEANEREHGIVLFCFVCLDEGNKHDGFFCSWTSTMTFFFRVILVCKLSHLNLKKNLNMVIGRKRDMAKSVHEALTWGCKSQS